MPTTRRTVAIGLLRLVALCSVALASGQRLPSHGVPAVPAPAVHTPSAPGAGPSSCALRGGAGPSPGHVRPAVFVAVDTATSPAPSVTVQCVDVRSGAEFDYFARHLLASGRCDTAWSADSTRLCLGTSDNLHQLLCPDGAGGAFAGWVDAGGAEPSARVQHFDATGAIVPGWPETGLRVSPSLHAQYNLDVASDGTGGVLLAWQDFRSGTNSDVYAQHVTAAGETAPGWPAAGLAVCDEAHEQAVPRVAADGAGGAFVVWQDRRSGRLAIYGQHLDGAASPAAGWSTGGSPLTASEDIESAPLLSGSGTTLTCVYRYTGAGGAGLRAFRLRPGDAYSGGATPASLTLVAGATEIGAPAARSGASGSTLVAWVERREGGEALRLQRLDGEGAPIAAWGNEAVLVCSSRLGRNAPGIVPEPDSGAVLVWGDFRAGTSDVYAQRVRGSGQVDAAWPPNGVAIAAGRGEQYAPSAVADGAGGALVTWADAAAGSRSGVLLARAAGGLLVQLSEATARPGHAHIVWQFAERVPDGLSAERSIGDAGEWQAVAAPTTGDSGRVTLDDRAAPEGVDVQYRLAIAGQDFIRYLEPVTLRIPEAPLHLALRHARALPSGDAIELSVTLPRGAVPEAQLFDVMGRRLERASFPGLEPGEQRICMRLAGRTPSGVYFVRLTQGSEARSAKVVIVR